MRIQDCMAYEELHREDLSDIESKGYLLRHKKTGARVVLMENKDENKVFYIGFRTPPVDSTGAAHIVEHTVLCGSKEFPIKDPFVELVKGSLNTFLNAMTYPDKTVFPVASCNAKDFQNLMHIYLDAVFYPNIYKEKKIFMQEGWHYELEHPEDQLTLNGVVYSEMKGAFSSPDDVLERQILNSLFPDNAYGFESGGDPDEIPELSYEKFLDFHRRYYHPSNCYIYLYGDMDMAEKLQFIDEHYLSKFEEQPIDSTIAEQKAFTKIQEVSCPYSISESESEKNNTYLALNKVVGDTLDPELYMAFQILDYALCSAPGAPLKQAMLDAGIGKDVYSIFDEGVKQPYFSVIAQNADADQKDAFMRIYEETLSRIVKEGIEKKALEAALNHYDFKFREQDFGSYPKGLMYGLQMLDTWLHEDDKPFIHLDVLRTISSLRQRMEEGYFEKLIEEKLLKNPFGSFVTLVPEKGLTTRREKALEDKLAKKLAGMSEQEKLTLVKETEELKEYQMTPDDPEALKCIPRLTREDLNKKAKEIIYKEHTFDGVPGLLHEVDTHEIGYFRLLFDCKDVSTEDFIYIPILKATLGMMDTTNYAYADLYHEIHCKTGGMGTYISSFVKIDKLDEYKITFDVRVKAMYHQLPEALDFMKEVIFETKFDDTKRLQEIINEIHSRAQSDVMSAGHVIAIARAISYQSKAGKCAEILNGVDQFRMIEHLTSHFEEEKDALVARLNKLRRRIFRPENLFVDYIAEPEGLPVIEEHFHVIKDALYTDPMEQENCYIPLAERKNEGFTSASQVQYVAVAGNFKKSNLPYTGALRALKVMLSYDYFWNEIRVLGGAYGCMCNFNRTGNTFFATYRDPNLRRSLEVFEGTAEYIRNFEDTEENRNQLTQYVISAIGDLDVPKSAREKGDYGLSCYMTNITYDMIQKERDELLQVTVPQIQKLADYLTAMSDSECLCVLGSEEKIKAEKELFMEITPMFTV